MAVQEGGKERKASSDIPIAFPRSALKGSVDFGPEVTSSDKSLKVLLNAEDKVSMWVSAVDFPGGTCFHGGVGPGSGMEAESPRRGTHPRARGRPLTLMPAQMSLYFC